MRPGAMLGILVFLGAAALVGCSQSEAPPPDAGDAGVDAGDAAEIPDCSYPCVGDGFVGAC